MRLEEAQELVRIVRVPLDDPRAGLRQHPPDQAAGLPQLLRPPLHRHLREADPPDRAAGDLPHGGLRLADHRVLVSGLRRRLANALPARVLSMAAKAVLLEAVRRGFAAADSQGGYDYLLGRLDPRV